MASAHGKTSLIDSDFIDIDIIFYFLVFFNDLYLKYITKALDEIIDFAQYYAKCTISLCVN